MPAREITLEELSVAIDGTAWRNRCLLGLLGCSEETPCVLHEYWGSMRGDILTRLSQVTLADMDRHHDPGVERCRARQKVAEAGAVG